MTLNEKYSKILGWFSENMPVAESELNYTNPFELLVAVVLSAQCTDKRVNLVTPALFKAYPTAFEMSGASLEDILHYISCTKLFVVLTQKNHKIIILLTKFLSFVKVDVLVTKP